MIVAVKSPPADVFILLAPLILKAGMGCPNLSIERRKDVTCHDDSENYLGSLEGRFILFRFRGIFLIIIKKY